MPRPDSIVIRELGEQSYKPVYLAMAAYTRHRNADSLDELWVVEHPPVFTQGRNSKAEHLLETGDIPVIDIDRGGQVTYHGPGQIVVYTLIDLPRAGLGVRDLVNTIENSVISLLADYGINASTRTDAPGVYIEGAKIAALGLRVKHGCSYHGLSLNVDMNLEPFSCINPCGLPGLEVTQLSELGVNVPRPRLADQLCTLLANNLGYNARVHNPSGELPIAAGET